MLKTQKVFWWRTGFANTEGKLGKEPDGEMGSVRVPFVLVLLFNLHSAAQFVS